MNMSMDFFPLSNAGQKRENMNTAINGKQKAGRVRECQYEQASSKISVKWGAEIQGSNFYSIQNGSVVQTF